NSFWWNPGQLQVGAKPVRYGGYCVRSPSYESFGRSCHASHPPSTTVATFCSSRAHEILEYEANRRTESSASKPCKDSSGKAWNYPDDNVRSPHRQRSRP